MSHHNAPRNCRLEGSISFGSPDRATRRDRQDLACGQAGNLEEIVEFHDIIAILVGSCRRLILVSVPSAVMRGTIRPDYDGQPARLDIQGTSDLESTFRIELNVATDGPFNTESVFFLTGGQVFGGTLAPNVLRPVTPGVDYRVVYNNVASGEFIVTGEKQFDEVVQNTEGVVGRQLN